MKTEIKAGDWTSGRRMYEIPYVNGQVHGIEKGWHSNGQRIYEVPYINEQPHGLIKWWNLDGSLGILRKRNQGQQVWEIEFPSEKQIKEDAELEVFFHPTPELS